MKPASPAIGATFRQSTLPLLLFVLYGLYYGVPDGDM